MAGVAFPNTSYILVLVSRSVLKALAGKQVETWASIDDHNDYTGEIIDTPTL